MNCVIRRDDGAVVLWQPGRRDKAVSRVPLLDDRDLKHLHATLTEVGS